MMSLFFSGISSTVLLYTTEDLVCLRVVLHFVSAVVRVKCVAFSVAPHFGSRRRICSRSIPLRMGLGIVMDILFSRQRTSTPFAEEKIIKPFNKSWSPRSGLIPRLQVGYMVADLQEIYNNNDNNNNNNNNNNINNNDFFSSTFTKWLFAY